MKTTTEKINFTRIDNDVNGNPRYVCHFLNLINDEESERLGVSQKYEYALKKSRALGGKKYHNKKYGGGIVFQSYNTDELSDQINELRGDKKIEKTKKEKIKDLVLDMLEDSYKEMIKQVDTALNSGAIDTEGWIENDKPMILPKCIVTAILQDASTQYEGKGTSYEKQIKKEVRNIRYFI